MVIQDCPRPRNALRLQLGESQAAPRPPQASNTSYFRPGPCCPSVIFPGPPNPAIVAVYTPRSTSTTVPGYPSRCSPSLGLQLVQDRASKRPFDPLLQLSKNIKQTSLANGLPCCPAGGTVDGKSGDHILLTPPFFWKTCTSNN